MTADLQSLGDWADLPFFRTDWPAIQAQIENDPRLILPPPPVRFAALERTPLRDVKVVILGQDPYPTNGHANGLAFSVQPGTPLPRSLRNIFSELEADIGTGRDDGDLGDWADQGVLLLNTALSVPEGAAGAHAKIGWTRLARQVIDRVSAKPTAFLLWGNHARQFAPKGDHLVIESAHPSPLSARRGFFGSRPFSRVNDWLLARGQRPITWA